MLSIAGLAEAKVQAICEKAAKTAGEGEVCQISTHLFQKGFAVGGTKKALDECHALAEKAKALQVRLIKNSGGFHTELMRPVKEILEVELQEMLPRMRRPR